jgi:DNA modification methylase
LKGLPAEGSRALDDAENGAASPDTLRLHWPGRTWEPRQGPRLGARRFDAVGPSALGFDAVGPSALGFDAVGPSALRPVRTVPTEIFTPGGPPSGTGSRLVHGDALDVASALAAEGAAGTVDLVYVDPPFASQAAYVQEARLDGPADGRVIRTQAYDDRWAGDGIRGYLDMLAPRLEALAGLLAPQGTLWVHVDWRASYLVRLILDEVMGRDAFVNEIVWRRAPNLGRQAASHQFGRTLDTLVVYGGPQARLSPPTRLEPIPPSAVRRDGEGRPFTTAPRGDYTDESIARLEAEGRVHRTASGRVYVKYFLVKNADGEYCRERRVDALWTDVAPLRHARTGERTGFPTQKPRALLDRIVACASPSGGLVVDVFGGSGTTGESAHALGRRFVVGDASAVAIGTARARLLRAGAAFTVEACRSPHAVDVAQGTAKVEVRVERRDEALHVELLSPRDALAWAIGVNDDPPQPFRTIWHSERAPGLRVRAVEPRATVPGGEAGPLAVRVWLDDGTVSTCSLEAP